MMDDAPERIWAGNWLADVGETLAWEIGEWRDEPWQTVDTVEYVIKDDYDALAAKLEDRLGEMERALVAARLALEAAEELHQVGILPCRIGLPEEVAARRSYALDVIRIQTGENE